MYFIGHIALDEAHPVSLFGSHGRVLAQSPSKKLNCQQQAAGVGLAHANTPVAERAINYGRAHITPLLKVTQSAKRQQYRQTV